jgi:Spy/CpxP family protein refolding chaperone
VKLHSKMMACAFATLMAVAPATLRAQQSPSEPPPASSGSGAGTSEQAPAPAPNRVAGGGACWRQAGITRAELQQRKAIQEKTRTQIAGVCANTSLTPKEKMQQVKEFRVAEKQQFADLLTPEQEKALKECQRARKDALHADDPGAPETSGPHPAASPCCQQ